VMLQLVRSTFYIFKIAINGDDGKSLDIRNNE